MLLSRRIIEILDRKMFLRPDEYLTCHAESHTKSTIPALFLISSAEMTPANGSPNRRKTGLGKPQIDEVLVASTPRCVIL